MSRLFLLGLALSFLFLSAGSALANRTTDDPRHPGYESIEGDLVSVTWSPQKTSCKPCEPLVEAYNRTMDMVLATRYQIASIEDELESLNDAGKFIQKLHGRGPKGEGLSPLQEKAAAAALNYQMTLQEMGERLPGLRQALQKLEANAADLRGQIRACERKHCSGGEGGNQLSTGIEPGSLSMVLPFDWRGPYAEVCLKCKKLADRLNELPSLAYQTMAKLDAAQAELELIEVELVAERGFHNSGIMNEIYANRLEDLEKMQRDHDRETRKRIEKLERRKNELQREIQGLERDLAAITQNFADTLKVYNECIKDCGEQTGMQLMEDDKKVADGCFYIPGTDTVIQIGENIRYGTGAQARNKVKDTAKGMAMGALGGVLGGKGIGLGGGDDGIGSPGGGSSQKGPKTEKDPMRGDYAHINTGGVDLGVRAGFTNDGLVVSQKIFDSPGGNGTFHATWLQDSKGRKMLPSRYYIYSLYVDHKLTVWWTYDRWVNGEHVAHDEGRETTTWRENLGDFKTRFGGEQGVENSIWYNMGFDTAVKGVRSLGALYPAVTTADLTGPCPLTMVTHVTNPGLPVVSTIPVIGQLFADKSAQRDERNLMIMVTPALVSGDED